MTDPLFTLAVLALSIAVSEWLVRHTFARHFGSALLVIVITAVVANLGLIPTSSTAEAPTPVYDAIFAYVAPISIFWLLLRVNLRDVLSAGLPMIALFLIGSIGTFAGVWLGMQLVNGSETIGPLYAALGGMFVGTYTGGSVNFNAIALEYEVVREGVLYGGAVAVDNILTAVWMVVTIAIPRLLAGRWPHRGEVARSTEVITGEEEDTESVHPLDLGLVLFAGIGGLWLSIQIESWLAGWGLPIPLILIVTTLALMLAQIPAVARLRGANVLAMFSVYLFLAVIGAFCDVSALQGLGQLGLILLAFATTVVFVHGLLVFGVAYFTRLDPDVTAVASQANVGGGTSALALARSLGRADLVVPGILMGALGNGLGTYLGFLAVGLL